LSFLFNWWSTQPSTQWLPGALFVGVKRSGRETDHSPPSGAASPILLHGVVLN